MAGSKHSPRGPHEQAEDDALLSVIRRHRIVLSQNESGIRGRIFRILARYGETVAVENINTDDLHALDTVSIEKEGTLLDAIIRDALQKDNLTSKTSVIRRLKKLLLQPSAPSDDL